MTGSIKGMSKDFKTGKYTMTLSINENNIAEDIYNNLHDVELLDIDVKKHREKKSLRANGYCWALMDKIAKKLNTTSEEVYEDFIAKSGFPYYDETGAPVVIMIKKSVGKPQGIHVRRISYGFLKDKKGQNVEYSAYMVIRGISDYNSKEMSQFIDVVIEEAKEQGIETLPPAEIQRLIEMWRKDNG